MKNVRTENGRCVVLMRDWRETHSDSEGCPRCRYRCGDVDVGEEVGTRGVLTTDRNRPEWVKGKGTKRQEV